MPSLSRSRRPRSEPAVCGLAMSTRCSSSCQPNRWQTTSPTVLLPVPGGPIAMNPRWPSGRVAPRWWRAMTAEAMSSTKARCVCGQPASARSRTSPAPSVAVAPPKRAQPAAVSRTWPRGPSTRPCLRSAPTVSAWRAWFSPPRAAPISPGVACPPAAASHRPAASWRSAGVTLLPSPAAVGSPHPAIHPGARCRGFGGQQSSTGRCARDWASWGHSSRSGYERTPLTSGDVVDGRAPGRRSHGLGEAFSRRVRGFSGAAHASRHAPGRPQATA
jgi:hypothetical protein